MNTKFYSNGKLLLTGEYGILDGALGLAIPTKYGQSLSLKKSNENKLVWTSLDENNETWFNATFLKQHNTIQLENKEQFNDTSLATADTLIKILTEATKLNPAFLSNNKGFDIETKLTFPRNWGLGSSSTLINNIASWAKVNAYTLLWNSFSGSAYDIACAQHNYPITYKLSNSKPSAEKVDFNPSFKNHLYFVYLNKKQNSREAIANYKAITSGKTELIKKLSEITFQIIDCTGLEQFNNLINIHENLLSEHLKVPTQKEALFPDFEGSIKSLGAWGGDFVLATGTARAMRYFKRKGYDTLIPFAEMIL